MTQQIKQAEKEILELTKENEFTRAVMSFELAKKIHDL